MKNLGILLDDKTIINFSFFFKLLKRYYLITTLSPILILGIGAYIYKTQNDVYMIATGMKIKPDAVGSEQSSKSLTSILGAEEKTLSVAEVLSMGKTIDFKQRVAEQIYNHQYFDRFNFNQLKSKSMKTNDQLFAACDRNKKCIVDGIRDKIGAYVEITMDSAVANKFKISVKTLDAFTSRELLDIVVKELKKSREKALQSSMNEQVKITKDLIEKKKLELENVNFIDLEDMLKKKEKELAAIDNSIRSYNRVLMNQKLQLNKAKLTVEETNIAINSDLNQKEKVKYQKYVELREQIDQLRDDLNALELAGGSSDQDKLIIQQVRVELRSKERELASIGSVRRQFSNVEKFKETKDKSSDFDNFNYKVLQGQIKKTQDELDKLLADKQKIEQERFFFEDKMKTLKPSFAYLKLLEDKLVQLELVKWTIVIDLEFDENIGNMRRFKRTTIGKIAIFSSLLSFFVIFLGILTRYIFDNRVYDEYEISRNFKGLDIIGNTPEF